MNYIVLDLEWNQSPMGREKSVEGLPFEIIEIGAVRRDEDLRRTDTFHRVIRPVVYEKLHFHVLELVHIGVDELRSDGEPFAEVFREFIEWCGDKPVFCTWGDMDLMQLQRNAAFHGLEIPFPYPLLFYDVQKLYSLFFLGTRKTVFPLDRAVRELGIEQGQQFHRALEDAEYTALILQRLDMEEAKVYLSMDYYRIPRSREEEIYLIFPDYSKYVSRAFDTKEEALADKTVTDMVCCRCNRMLRKRIRWFSPNQRQYHCLAVCPEHGLVKGKIRFKHSVDHRLFAVKTIKLASEETAREIERKREESSRRHKRTKL